MPALTIPTIQTDRLILRPYTREDASELAERINDPRIAATTARIPHPYAVSDAIEFFEMLDDAVQKGESCVWAACLHTTGELIGSVGLEIATDHNRAELGYWIAPNHWNNGYATEAASAALDHAFNTLKLNRVHACHYAHNPASGSVQQKLGMKHEGTLRQHIVKDGVLCDTHEYGILAHEFKQS